MLPLLLTFEAVRSAIESLEERVGDNKPRRRPVYLGKEGCSLELHIGEAILLSLDPLHEVSTELFLAS